MNKNLYRKKNQFKPCEKFRYLKGEIQDDANRQDLKLYNEHRYNIFMATPVIDTKPLGLNPNCWVNFRKLNRDVEHALIIDKENKELLKKINFINRNGGIVDTYNPDAYRRVNSWKSHERRMLVIQKHNRSFHDTLINAKSNYPKAVFDSFWQKQLVHMALCSKYPLVIVGQPDIDRTINNEPSISLGLERGNVERPLCFLEFKVVDGEHLGRAIIELYYDHVPVTVQNFLSIIKGDDRLSYKNCLIHRIVKGKYLETGDIVFGTGRGGFSIYGSHFHEEGHKLKHTKPGVLSMIRIPPAVNHSQFCITFTKMEQLDLKNVVFGRIIKGNKILGKIEGYARKIGKPYADIIISNCGEIEFGATSVGESGPSTIKSKTGGVRNVGDTVSVVSGCTCLPDCQCQESN